MPNSTDEHGTTAADDGRGVGQRRRVKALIEHGADVNAREGAHGQTALMFAAALNRAAADPVLMENGADAGVTTKAVKLAKPAVRDSTTAAWFRKAKDAKTAQARRRRGSGGPESRAATLWPQRSD